MRINSNKIGILAILVLLFCSGVLQAKSLPSNMIKSADGLQLSIQKQELSGIYSLENIPEIKLQFNQSNWWNLLKANYQTKTDIPADLTYNGVTYPNVGIRFRGQTSYQRVTTQKKSFNITIDYTDENQRIEGYKTLNLNNCYEDPSFMREVLYTYLIGRNIPSAKANFVKLTINGESWGLYGNVQQLNGDFYKEWFLSNNGANWRAEIPDTSSAAVKPGGTPGQPPGANFGAGVCSLNDLGSVPLTYSSYYTLKSSDIDNTWEVLALACKKLNSFSGNDLYDSLQKYIDVDRCLWHIASEIVFTDDDGYVNKGGMDYYVYYDVETGRIQPIEYDGNSSFLTKNVSWSPFLKETDTKYPLINKLLSSPALKQRYAAHVRSIMDNILTDDKAIAQIDKFDNLIKAEVSADTKKLYTVTAYNSSITELKNFIKNRKIKLSVFQMISAVPPVISNVQYISSRGINVQPNFGEKIRVQAEVTSADGISKVLLYHGTGLAGTFEYVEMFDDGLNNDETAGDGIYSGEIPARPVGTYVRFYIEARSNNTFKTASFSPEGAEHDVYLYQTEPEIAANSDIVINEVMASNSKTIADPQGEYDDWVELYNKSTQDVNIGGMYLTDKIDNPKKWQFPANTIIKAGEYLLVWCDENSKATPGIHTNFKLSGDGEVVVLIDKDANNNRILDSISFPALGTDIAFGRYPNGTGSFIVLPATPEAFNKKADDPDPIVSDVVINELMSSNETTTTDPQGGYDDWVELYNKGSQAINLTGMYLTDKTDNPKKWQFPDNTIIQAGEYLIIWADENASASPGLHTNFKLSGDGEMVLLVDSDANSNRVLDSIKFPALGADIAYGRYPNGTGNFKTINPSPGSVNLDNVGVDDNNYSANFNISDVYPNPASQLSRFSVHSDGIANIDISIYDTFGRCITHLYNGTISEGETVFEWDGTNSYNTLVSTGVYNLVVKNGSITITRLIVRK